MSLLGGSLALAVALVLLAAGAGHLRDRRGLRAALAAHDLLPLGMRRPVVLLLGPVEVALAVGLVAGVALGGAIAGSGVVTDGAGMVFLVAAFGATLLTGAFTAYLLLVLRRTGGEEIPCGCGLGATPVGPWAVVRAGLLAAFALLAVVAGVVDRAGVAAGAGDAPLWAQALLVVAAGTTLAVAVAALPAARAVPSALTTLPAAPRRGELLSTSGGRR